MNRELQRVLTTQLRQSNIYDLYCRIVQSNSAIRYVVSSADLVIDENGNVVEMLGTTMDITTSHDEKEELELLKYALDQIDEAAYLVDEFAQICYANDGASKQTGYSVEELMRINAFSLTNDFQPELWQSHWDELKEKKTLVLELKHKRKDGSLFDVEIVANYIEYNDKFYNLGMVRDITKRKEIEEKLAQQQSDLELLNAKLSEKVDFTVSKLEENEKIMIIQSRQAAMGEMISMIAHQWRQPLSSIAATALDMKLSIELDSESFDEEEPRNKFLESSLSSLDDIELYIKNLTHTIDDFRNFYKPDKESVEANLSSAVEKTLQIVQTAFESKGVTIHKNYESNKVVTLYENEIIQVLLNILKNAQDNFLEKDIKDATINIDIKDNENGVFVDICDNGGGIDENIILNIFDPYFSTKDEKNGTGLGLYMSKIIVEEHHKGKITAQNRDDGVCFRINIR